jgi:hypothetical protein
MLLTKFAIDQWMNINMPHNMPHLCHTSIIIYAKLDHGIRKGIPIISTEKTLGDFKVGVSTGV